MLSSHAMKSSNLNKEQHKCLKQLKRKIKKLDWFPKYQSFSEIGIKGLRNDSDRYTHLGFSICKDKVIADYGCNLGQTVFMAVKHGAQRAYGFDRQRDTIESARELQSILGYRNVEFHVIDFNDQEFNSKINRIFNDHIPDISFFLSVYRTKELTQRDDLLRFILNNTKEIVFFEGHSDRKIDTIEYYENVFKGFDVSTRFLGYSQIDTRPLFMIEK